MRATFDEFGNLILHPESTLERMACQAFVASMSRRSKPEIRVEGIPTDSMRELAALKPVADLPGQQKLAEAI